MFVETVNYTRAVNQTSESLMMQIQNDNQT